MLYQRYKSSGEKSRGKLRTCFCFLGELYFDMTEKVENHDTPRIFISHSWEDKDLVRRLEDELKLAGAEVWVDYSSIRGGDNLPKQINDALEWCNTLLLVWSKAARNSYWVELEWTSAISLKKVIIPSSVKPKPPKILPTQPLLLEPLPGLSNWAVAKMLKTRNFFDAPRNEDGKGLYHQYNKSFWKKTVTDHTTDLIWQRSGSEHWMNYKAAKIYIAELNQKCFGEHNEWRLPTLEEAMSLMEAQKRNYLYIDQAIDQTQQEIWTADRESANIAWVIRFNTGNAATRYLNRSIYVRAVRSTQ